VLTLPLDLFPSPIGGGSLVNQDRELCFGRIPGLARNRKLALEKGDLLSCLVSLPTSRSEKLSGWYLDLICNE
jgi:hypothetical protein